MTQAISDHQRSKRKIEFCEITRENGSKYKLTDQNEIAGHIAGIYGKTFNNNFSLDINGIKQFLTLTK